jgi:ABC-type lipoprotein export system ATPase subunit
MANEPALLLADEVVAQLDADTAAGVIDDVLTADFALLYVTHDVEVADLADRRYELADHAVHLR